ncbi:MAG: Flp family type IVb pilin [Allosphingosinicella sp.]|jgi:pilus assembly protein Flp/PilA
MRQLRSILRDRRGGTAIEYALVAALIAIAAIAAFKNLGTQIDNTLGNVNSGMSRSG